MLPERALNSPSEPDRLNQAASDLSCLFSEMLGEERCHLANAVRPSVGIYALTGAVFCLG